MNRIVLIGNGFDLAHGLNTSYKHFICWYLNQWGNHLLHGIGKEVSDGLLSMKIALHVLNHKIAFCPIIVDETFSHNNLKEDWFWMKEYLLKTYGSYNLIAHFTSVPLKFGTVKNL